MGKVAEINSGIQGEYPQDLISEIDTLLRLGVLGLLDRKYKSVLKEDSKFLCAGILNSILLEEPNNSDAQKYLENNYSFIEQQAHCIMEDGELAYAACILSSFTILILGRQNFERTIQLADRASELGIVLKSTEEIYPTDDPAVFFRAVHKYARELACRQVD